MAGDRIAPAIGAAQPEAGCETS